MSEAASTAPDGVTVTSESTPSSSPQVSSQEKRPEPLLNYHEVVELRKEVRGMEKLLREALSARTPVTPEKESKPAEKVAPSADASEALAAVETLRRELVLERTLGELGLKPGPQRELIEKAVAVDRPQDIREYVQRYASVIAPPPPKTEAPPPPPKLAERTNTGAPGTDPTSALPNNPRLIPPEVWRSPDFDRKGAMARHLASDGNGPMWEKRKPKP